MLNQTPTDFGIPAESQFQGFGISRLVVFAVANAALKSYSDTLAIFERLANFDPAMRAGSAIRR
jgi:hypothetical protein